MLSDDITWCYCKCDNKKCFRNTVNMRDRARDHSFAEFKGTETCPLTKKEGSNKKQ